MTSKVVKNLKNRRIFISIIVSIGQNRVLALGGERYDVNGLSWIDCRDLNW